MEAKIKIIKSVCFSFICFLLATLFWYLLKRFFLWQEGRILVNLVYAFISFSLFFIFLMVYLTLIDSRKIVLISSFFTVFSFLVFFLTKNGKWVSIPAIICYIIFAWVLFAIFNLTNKNLIYEKKNSIVFHLGKSILKSAPSILIIFAILFSVVFYFNFPFIGKEGRIILKEEHVERLTRSFGEVVNRYIPIYDLDMAVDEFIVLTTFMGLPFAKGKDEEELKPPVDIEKPPEEIIDYFRGKGIYNLEEVNVMDYIREDTEFGALFIEEIKKLASEANPYIMNKYRKNLSENWGIEISSKDRMGEVYTRLINSKINEIPKKIRDLILIFPAIALFGILEVVFLILNFLFSFICWILLIIFYKAKFYHLRKVQVEKEEIEL